MDEKRPASSTREPDSESAPLVIPYGVPVDNHLFPQPYLLLPLYRPRRRHPRCCRFCTSSVVLSSASVLLLLLLLAAGFLLWPSDPQVQVARLHLQHVKVVTKPSPYLDISMDLRVRVRNPNFFSLDYNYLVASIGYRGRALGMVTSGGGRIKARGTSYVDASLKLDGVRVVSDVFYLIEDLARGAIPFDTVTELDGTLRLLFLEIPIEGKVSCSVNVDPGNQIILRQECSPK